MVNFELEFPSREIVRVSWFSVGWLMLVGSPVVSTTNVQYSSSSCKGASRVLQITGQSDFCFFRAGGMTYVTLTLCFKLRSFFTVTVMNLRFLYFCM